THGVRREAPVLQFRFLSSSSCVSPECCTGLANLEHQHRPALGNHRFGSSHLVDPVLNALRIKSPTGRVRYVLLAIDLKGCGNANHAGGRREAPQFIPRPRIDSPTHPAARPTLEHNTPATTQRRS